MRVAHEVTGLHAAPSQMQFKYIDVDAFRVHWHQHPEWELTYILSGSGYRMVGGSIEVFFAGDAVLLGGNLPHTWVSEPHPDGSQAIVLHLTSNLIREFAQIPGAERFQGLASQAGQGLCFDSRGSELSDRMRAGLGAQGLAMHAAAAHVFDLLERLPVRALSAPSPPRVLHLATQNALERTAQRFRDPEFNLTELAAWVGMEKSPFCTQFKRATGRTFSQHLHQLRTANAARELATTSKSVRHIAFHSGYDSIPYFNRMFRAVYGVTPGEFRQKISAHSG